MSAVVTFLEPGGDADFAVATTNGFWGSVVGSVAIATDFVHGSHVNSIKCGPGFNYVRTPANILNDTGTLISFYIYFNAIAAGGTAEIFAALTSGGSNIFALGLGGTGGAQLQLFNSSFSQLGVSAPAFSTGTWYRISIGYSITSSTVNSFTVYINGVSQITASNTTLVVGSNAFQLGNISGSATTDIRISDHYVVTGTTADPGNVWVTAKRPLSNGPVNQFTTQIGSGSSGYGSGHAPQVNERPLNTSNGWSGISAGSNLNEGYVIEGASVGDIDVSSATVLAISGWVSASSLASETAQITLVGIGYNISLTSTISLFDQPIGTSTYPSVSFDIGITTSATVTTVSLYECGILVAFIPATAGSLTPSATDSSAVSDTDSMGMLSFISMPPMIQGLRILGP